MSSLARLMSGVLAAVGDAALSAPPLQAAATNAAQIAKRSARPIPKTGYGPSRLGRSPRRGRLMRAPLGGRRAEALVIDVFRDRRMLAARGTLRIAAQPHLAEG